MISVMHQAIKAKGSPMELRAAIVGIITPHTSITLENTCCKVTKGLDLTNPRTE